MPSTREPRTEKTFGDIGEFVVAFEHVMGSLARAVMFALTNRFGLREQEVARMLLAKVGARDLIDRARAVLHHLYVDAPQSQAVINSLCRRAESLVKSRNGIIHSLWFIGYGSGGNLEPGRGFADKLVKRGISLNRLEAENLRLLASIVTGKAPGQVPP